MVKKSQKFVNVVCERPLMKNSIQICASFCLKCPISPRILFTPHREEIMNMYVTEWNFANFTGRRNIVKLPVLYTVGL